MTIKFFQKLSLITKVSRYFNKRKSLLISLCLLTFGCIEYSRIVKNNGTRTIETQGYLVNNTGCQLADYDAWDLSVLPFVRNPKNITCDTPLVILVNQSLVMTETALQLVKHNGAECCYKVIRRSEDRTKNARKADFRFTTESKCLRIPATPVGIQVFEQYVKVECNDTLNTFRYEDFFPIVLSPHSLNNDTKRKYIQWNPSKQIEASLPPSVIVLSIDSVSRLNMIRSLPETKKFLQNNDFLEMKGYTKIGENTYPSVMASFTGLKEHEQKACKPYYNSTFDDCPFIWKRFSQLDYVTGEIEDSPETGPFQYAGSGFVRPPVDYYPRPILLAESKSRNSEDYTKCFAGGLTHAEVISRYTLQVLKHMTNSRIPYFLITWYTTIAHDSMSGLRNKDAHFHPMLDELVSTIGENTVIFFISDHGPRFGRYRRTRLGFYEESLPFFFVRLPPSLKSRYPEFYTSMEINQNRLTTPYDFHSTLQAIYNIARDHESLKSLSLDTKGEPEKLKEPSLFQLAPLNRTCATSHIPEKYCRCGTTPNVEYPSGLITKLGHFIINMVNEKVETNFVTDKCASLHFSKVVYELPMRSEVIQDNFGKPMKHMVIILAVESAPGGRVFESYLSYYENGTILGLKDITTISQYKNKSDCVEDRSLKPFCVCRDSLLLEPKNSENADN